VIVVLYRSIFTKITLGHRPVVDCCTANPQQVYNKPATNPQHSDLLCGVTILNCFCYHGQIETDIPRVLAEFMGLNDIRRKTFGFANLNA